MATVSEHLVGRAAELGSLDLAVEGLKRGQPAVTLLVGEPGIGKTRLLAELAAHADARGCIVLTGSASELEADLPFWIFVDALEEYVAGLDPRRLASLDDDVRAELALVFPSLSDLAAARGAVLQDERYRTHRAVRELLERVAATVPLVLVLDDVHWADAASIDLLAALLRRPPAAAVLLALAARPRQLPDRLAGALERACRDGAADPFRARRACGARRRASCSATTVDGALADALYGESGGNPFYLEQLARSVRPDGRAGTGRCERRRSRASRSRPPSPPRSPTSSRCWRRARAGCWRARRSRATRSSRSWRPPPRQWTRRPPRRRSTTCSRSA